jgi:Zn-dependent alcohol dehydrogenase
MKAAVLRAIQQPLTIEDVEVSKPAQGSAPNACREHQARPPSR